MRAVIYTRVSNDQSGRSTSTADQERECRTICERNGWDVAHVLTDNDIGASRWSSKDRPAYRQLADTLQPGDVLVTWEASRAQRDLNAYVQLRDLCAERSVQWCYSGRLYDLATGDDRFTTGLDALLAEKEAEQIRERVLRGKRSAAIAGRPAGNWPYGYLPVRDPLTGRTTNWAPDPDRAPVVQEAVKRILAGDTLYAICKDFDDRGIRPRSGRTWVRAHLRTMLMSPSYAGLRTHQGEVIGPASWEPLISVDDHRALLAVLADPARRSVERVVAKHLLTGIARCGVCGAPVRYFGPKSVSTPRYQCQATSCVGRRADAVDDLVTETVLSTLEQQSPADYVADDPEAAAALREASELRARLDAFTDQAADGSLSPAALARIEARLLPQIRAAEQRATRRPTALPDDLVGANARATWEQLELADRRRIIRGLVSVTINRSTAAVRQFNPADIAIDWL
ncbi:recombinase family protein [Gordonia amicalis]|uniref:Recombinase family protein n=1 Tax=Gordonia amicalis TaxID=89053 RepID=A0ABU4DJP8_9ACTN|nr:recombinase family protein [Gordonia amicalis]MDV6309948.1 recombinase family protein [Gordonia amicalis]